MIEVKDEHIIDAERVLINGKKFDSKERIPFIKELNSCDLLAVPGSGKTTALLAKLYCLSKHLPFKYGSGILVLSHTNAAVDEIKKNLQKHSPQLFEYPNFVGTVQSFVNKFIANPACFLKYGSYILNNDNDIYEKEAEKYFYSLKYSPKGVEPKNLKNKLIGRVNQGKSGLTWAERDFNVMNFLKFFEFNISNRKILNNGKSFYTYSGISQNYYLELEQWKESLFVQGILNYRDSFYLANWFLESNPFIINILQKRFKFVFIDEMQDLERYQIDIIDKVFHGKDSKTIIQRIGDINQSIYNSGKKVKVEADWEPREPVMYLNGTNRLTKENADIVNYFTLDRQKDTNGNPRFVVEGLRTLKKQIEPHLVLFDENTTATLEEKFKELINKYTLQNTDEGKKYGFKIIGWNAKWDDEDNHDGKLRLEDIFKEYKKESSGKKETFDSLSKYLQYFDHNIKTLADARKAILNALIHILRIENKTYLVNKKGKEVERYYSKKELIKYIQTNDDQCDYELFKDKLYNWSFDLAVKRKYKEVYENITKFINEDFKDWLDFSISESTEIFIGENFEQIKVIDDSQKNDIHDDEIKLEIGTVHSAKGQTHCATMYVETSYHNYETCKLDIVSKKATKTKPEVKLPNPLLKAEHAYRNNKDIRAKETLKMMYVGFSRPTHLLCFAAFKDNIINTAEYKEAGWKIVDLTN